MKSRIKVEPFYFGPTEKCLFGCYHPSRARQTRNCGVVICQPIGHEYIYCHRALRQLAARLSEVGFPVLRFDLYGCGDSYGDLEEASLAQWQQDISSAIAELQSRSDVERICLIGVRLAATLCYIAAAREHGIESMVLWEPIVVGKLYLEELRTLQKEASRYRPKSPAKAKGGCEEIIGFPLSAAMSRELNTLNLLSITPKLSTKILTVRNQNSTDQRPSKDNPSYHGIQSDYQEIQAPKMWLPTVDGSLLVPNQALRSIVSWTCNTQS